MADLGGLPSAVDLAASGIAVADPVGFDEVRSNPAFLIRWRPITTCCSTQAEHRPDIHSLFILSVSADIHCCQWTRFNSVESYFFFPYLLFPFFFPSLSLSPGMGSEPTFYLSLFFFLLFFSPSFTLFSPSFFVLL